tara:strand:- start:559 stop:1347 length:789 start_codon:yes stop_codon:yes gene_type:complete
MFGPVALEAEMRELVGMYGPDMGRALFEQEYMCSFDAAIMGAVWGPEISAAEREGRIASVPYDPNLPVHTAWDIGMRDATSIWWFQVLAGGLHVIDYYSNHIKGAPHYASVVLGKPYSYGTHWMPQDAKVREWGSDRTRVESLIGCGLSPRLVRAHGLHDGINAARMTIPRCTFDAARTKEGLDCLKSYQYDWDEKNRRFMDDPKHDWASHGADAFRYLSMAWRELRGEPVIVPGRRLAVGPTNELRMDDLWDNVPKTSSRY